MVLGRMLHKLLCAVALVGGFAVQAQQTLPEEIIFTEDYALALISDSTRSRRAALDSAAVPDHEERRFDAAALERIKADTKGKYVVAEEKEPTLWQRFRDWLGRQLGRTLGSGPANWFIRNLWVLLIIAAVLITFFTFRKKLFTAAFARDVVPAVSVSDIHTELQEEDLAARISEAEQAGAWRRAIRLHYLQVLRGLADSGTITLKADATERDYSAQLRGKALRDPYDRLALVFQWTWYGEAPLDAERYQRLAQDFRNFKIPNA